MQVLGVLLPDFSTVSLQQQKSGLFLAAFRQLPRLPHLCPRRLHFLPEISHLVVEYLKFEVKRGHKVGQDKVTVGRHFDQLQGQCRPNRGGLCIKKPTLLVLHPQSTFS
jgi:hypothetical protein